MILDHLGFPIVAHDTEHLHRPDDVQGGERRIRGRTAPRDYGRLAYGAVPGVTAFDMPIIPRNDWPALFAKKDAEKSWLYNIWQDGGRQALDQDGLPYCWTYAVCSGVAVERLAKNEKWLDISPESVAAPIKNYRAEGGWGIDAANFMADKGFCTTATWPLHSVLRTNDNEFSRAERVKHKLTSFGDMERSNIEQLVTAVAGYNRPCPIGVDNWGHEILCVGFTFKNDKLMLMILNSWGDWGVRGLGWITLEYATPFDALFVRGDTLAA